MSDFTKEKVNKLADLLMIGLTEEENKMVLDEFESIDTEINKLNDIKGLDKVSPMTHALDDFQCDLRKDEWVESPKIEELLQNCDVKSGREVEVAKVVE